MACSESSMPSSMFTSIRLAPFRTCSAATCTASPMLPVLISRANLADPVTFVRSPIIWKLLSGRIVSVSSPANCVYVSLASAVVVSGAEAVRRTCRPFTPSIAAPTALIWSGVVPQQPPSMLTRPLVAKSRSRSPVSAGS